MKRRQLIRHLEEHHCYVLREGKEHTIYKNGQTNQQAPVPRHSEIDNKLARRICKQLGVPVIN
ncbi:MAG: type II toxin-antitoxin system HicA family toxin [bacterium]|nr:type II toxin-antitoxin system HicA family toxin [bacterium]